MPMPEAAPRGGAAGPPAPPQASCGAAPGEVAEPLPGGGASVVAGGDDEGFWTDWAQQKYRLHSALDQELMRQEWLVRNYLGGGSRWSSEGARRPSWGDAAACRSSPVEQRRSRGRLSAERYKLGSPWQRPLDAVPLSLARSESQASRSPQRSPGRASGSPRTVADHGGLVQEKASHEAMPVSPANTQRNADSSCVVEAGVSREVSAESGAILKKKTISGSEAFRGYSHAKKAGMKQKTFMRKFGGEGSIIGTLFPRVAQALDWWVQLEEPPRTSCLARVVLHSYFDTLISVIILANSIYTSYESNYEMDKLGETPDYRREIELLFLCTYLAELVLKIKVHGWYYFCNNEMLWNWFDFTLVLFSAFDLLLTAVGSAIGNVTFARSLRLFKLGKIFRIFRTMRFLRELRVMLASIVGSTMSLFWSVVMISMILYVFSLLFLQQMTMELIVTYDHQDSFLWQQQRHFFRNIERTMLTLLQTTMGGLDWDTIYILIEPLGLIYIFAFIFYIIFYNFAVLNILTGIFVENAMKLCQPDQEEREAEQHNLRQRDMAELMMLVEAMDADRSGTIKREEFLDIALQPEVGKVFARLGLDIKDPNVLFNAISEGAHTTEVPIADFVQRAIMLQGQASSLDLYGLIRQTNSVQQSLSEVRKKSDMSACAITEMKGEITGLCSLEHRVAENEERDMEVMEQLSAMNNRMFTLEGLPNKFSGLHDAYSARSLKETVEEKFVETRPSPIVDDLGAPTSRL